MLSRLSLFLFSSTASCATLPVHRSSPVLNAVELKVQIPMLKATVWYFMTPRAPHRDSLIATIPRTIFIMLRALRSRQRRTGEKQVQ